LEKDWRCLDEFRKFSICRVDDGVRAAREDDNGGRAMGQTMELVCVCVGLFESMCVCGVVMFCLLIRSSLEEEKEEEIAEWGAGRKKKGPLLGRVLWEEWSITGCKRARAERAPVKIIDI